MIRQTVNIHWPMVWFGIRSISTRAFNRIKFHFPVSECYNRVDNRIGNIAKIIG